MSVQIFVASHFAQPNSIEFEPALRWRHLQRSLADAKRLQREAHASDLAEVMHAYQKVGGCRNSTDKHQLLPSILYCSPFALHDVPPLPLLQQHTLQFLQCSGA